MSTRAVEIVSTEIQRQSYTYRPRHKGGQIWICCPLHGERSASCRINLDSTKGLVGNYYCFGCGKKGTWNMLCKTTRMATLSDDDLVAMNGYKRSTKARRRLEASLGETSSASSLEEILLESFRTKTTFELEFLEMERWRTISMRMLNKLGAKVIIDKRGESNAPALFLPQYVNGKIVGGIKAALEKVKGQLSYVESMGEWSMTQGLYPYDYVSDMLVRKDLRFVVLVEGPRDAIKLIGRGIPALAILGTQKWSDAKRDLLMALDIDLAILYMDGDKAGRSANKKLKAELATYLLTKTISLTALGKELGIEDLDPAKVPREYMQDIWDLAERFVK